jgi:hypothetical protein
MQSMPREAIVETLLNTLAVERHLRGPLLLTIVDELASDLRLDIAANLARDILENLERGQLVDAEFSARIDALRQLVNAASAISASSAA